MEPWYKVVTPRKEVREGRSFNPDEFAIALEQVVAGTAPEDYRDATHFFARTCFTRTLREHAGMVLRRLAGKTENSAPVLTLITQFGGGKTHTLTALYHLARNCKKAAKDERVAEIVKEAGLSEIPAAKVAVFVGNAWDPREGYETPWIDVARQLAGDKGVATLGTAAKTTAPGTEALGRLFEAGGGGVLILFDEVLNFMSRHQRMAEGLRDFIQNLTVAMTGTPRGAAVISLPRSQVTEMSDSDLAWQEKITKVVRRVAKDLISNDESEISEVIRRRLFDDIGRDSLRRAVARTYADWCFERRAQLPPEWTAVDTATTEAKAREFLRARFEVCYPFHPATLSVFQRKWSSLKQYQQTRGTLAMLAQWISWAHRDGFRRARREPLITLGSAPLDVPDFRAVILGQLGEPRLMHAIEADIAGANSHSAALDADTKGPLTDIHRRVASTILFESSGGQSDKFAHLPELRFALGEPEVETTSIDNAAAAFEARGFYIRRAGANSYRFGFAPTLKKVVNDRRAGLDEKDVSAAVRGLVEKEFRRAMALPVVLFPEDGAAVADVTRLTLIILDPSREWTDEGPLRSSIGEWTKRRGKSPRLYPGSLVWCIRKPGRELTERVENLLAWKRVQREVNEGIIGGDFERDERAEIASKVRDAEDAAKDEAWAAYRYAVLADSRASDGLKVIDLGAGHASATESLGGRVLAAMKTESLLNERPGAQHLLRHWPDAFKAGGAWPLTSLRQAFLTGALNRLVDPDEYLRRTIPEFVEAGELGFASGYDGRGAYARVWFKEPLASEDVVFEEDVYLLTKDAARTLKGGTRVLRATPEAPADQPGRTPTPRTEGGLPVGGTATRPPMTGRKTLRISGAIPADQWNRIGLKLVTKVKSGTDLRVGIDITVSVDGASAASMIADIEQALGDLNLGDRVRVEVV